MSSESSNPLHVVLGSGQVGVQVAEGLVRRGARVRVVRRGDGPEVAGTTRVRGNVSDQAFAEEAMRGASVVYQCAIPSYERWHDELPGLIRGVLHGAAKAGARLVVLDNVYMYGAVGPQPFDEDTPVRPNSRKGELRARIAEEIQRAHDRGDLRVAVGRAADFFGPRTPIAVVFAESLYRRLLAGESAQVVGDPEQPHSYAYTPDVAEALITLGAREEALGKVWHLPVVELSSTRALVERVARALIAPGSTPTPVPIEAVSDAVLEQLGRENAVIAEMVEMTYQYKVPYILDDRRIRSTFGLRATPVEEAVERTAQWARDAYGRA